MIDYLERLFVQHQRDEQGEEAWAAPSALLTQEPVQNMPVSQFRDEAQWQQEAARRLESALSVPGAVQGRLEEERSGELPRVMMSGEDPVFGVYAQPASVPGMQEVQGEDLEHRLRRNSRRYDSGFFLY